MAIGSQNALALEAERRSATEQEHAANVRVAMATVVAALESLRVTPTSSEYQLHTAISDVLSTTHGVSYRHEVPLARRSRIDFVARIDGVVDVGIEVKKGKPPAQALYNQALRYAETQQLHALVLVVEQSVAFFTWGTVGDLPVQIVALNKLWGVSL